MQAGQVALLHNWTVHRSGVNASTTMARRAFSVNYMDGRSKITDVNLYAPRLVFKKRIDAPNCQAYANPQSRLKTSSQNRRQPVRSPPCF
jgi:hypothetical protein